MNLIKKYKNRKYYDTNTSEYITLEEMLTMNSIKVINHENTDITKQVLIDLICLKLKKQLNEYSEGKVSYMYYIS